jgi:hypothetical protein
MVFSVLLMIKHCTVNKCILQLGADVDKNNQAMIQNQIYTRFLVVCAELHRCFPAMPVRFRPFFFAA